MTTPQIKAVMSFVAGAGIDPAAIEKLLRDRGALPPK